MAPTAMPAMAPCVSRVPGLSAGADVALRAEGIVDCEPGCPVDGWSLGRHTSCTAGASVIATFSAVIVAVVK